MDVKPGRIELHIDSLVLEGLDSVTAAQVGTAVQQNLTRLIDERGLPHHGLRDVRTTRLEGGTFTVAPGDRAEAVGDRIAHAVYRGLTYHTNG